MPNSASGDRNQQEKLLQFTQDVTRNANESFLRKLNVCFTGFCSYLPDTTTVNEPREAHDSIIASKDTTDVVIHIYKPGTAGAATLSWHLCVCL